MAEEISEDSVMSQATLHIKALEFSTQILHSRFCCLCCMQEMVNAVDTLWNLYVPNGIKHRIFRRRTGSWESSIRFKSLVEARRNRNFDIAQCVFDTTNAASRMEME